MNITLSKRAQSIPKYMFTAAREKLKAARTRGLDVIDFGVGDPDTATPQMIINELNRASHIVEYHRYPPDEVKGMMTFREATARWLQHRFGLTFDPETEITGLIGAKESFHHLTLAFLNPGEIGIVPSPGYIPYGSGVILAGGTIFEIPLRPENQFQPDINDIPPHIAEQTRIIFLNYPNNPTAAMADKKMFEALVAFAHQHHIILVNDAAYCELYLDDIKPLSIFEIDGAKDCAVEIYSFTKSFNMAGWRLGMAAGNPDLIAGLIKMKDNTDSGVFGAIQAAGIVALDHYEELMPEIRDRYRQRRDRLITAFQNAGINVDVPSATCYIWSQVPAGYTSNEFCDLLLEKAGIFVLPGAGYGTYGEHYFRLSLTVPDDEIDMAVERIEKLEF